MTTPGEIWDLRFAERQWPADPDAYLLELADPLPAGRGLDLGAGPGRNSLWLAARGWDMTLVDASRVGLDQAEAAARILGAAITTVQADVSSWQIEGSAFDLVIVANLHPGPDAMAALLARSARALCPGGHLYVVGHHLDNLGRHGPSDPDRLLTVERLRAALPSNLDVEVLEKRERNVDHGATAQPAKDTVVLAWAARPPAGAEGRVSQDPGCPPR